MKFHTRSGNTYQYDRYSNKIGIATSGGDKPLEALTFDTVPEATSLSNLSTFIVELTRECNLRCRYCCYSGKYPQHRVHEDKSDVTFSHIEAVGDFIAIHKAQERQLYIFLYGGEPFMQLNLLKQSVDYFKSRFEGVDITISTNLTLQSKEILEWCVSNDLTLNVSLDGSAEYHNRNRVNASGAPTFDKVYHRLLSLYNLNEKYFDDKVNILMTIEQIENLLPIAKYWGRDILLKGKEPYLITGIAPNYPDVMPIDESAVLGILYELLDYYSHNRDNLFCKAYFEQLISLIIDRDVYDLYGNMSGLVCLPYNKRLFFDVKGQIGICEKCNDNLRIGSLEKGLDFEKINQLISDYAAMRKQRCSKCEIVRLCQTCFSVAHLSENALDMDCESNRTWIKIAMTIACEMAEQGLIESEDAKKCSLHPLSYNDADAVSLIMGDKEVLRYMDGMEPFKTIEQSQNFLSLFDRREENVPSLMYGIYYMGIGLVGLVGFDTIEFNEENKVDGNLFFVLNKDYWHKGIMTAMLSQFITKYVNQYKQKCQNDIIAITNSVNVRAIKLIAKFEIINKYKH